MKKNKFYTGKGDKGYVKINSKTLPKNNKIFHLLGELDELNSLIGLSKNYLPVNFKKLLEKIQENLFIIQAIVAEYGLLGKKSRCFSLQKINELEKEIKFIEDKCWRIKNFIIPGSNKTSAWLDYLRSVTRRVERWFVDCQQKLKLPPEPVIYINRLSSYFYALARFYAFKNKIKEKSPKYE